jgi:hypothetical protein
MLLRGDDAVCLALSLGFHAHKLYPELPKLLRPRALGRKANGAPRVRFALLEMVVADDPTTPPRAREVPTQYTKGGLALERQIGTRGLQRGRRSSRMCVAAEG